ncbi:hypothetical protein BDF14DRAFT_1710323, partial [Spinellus fusiger]
NLQEIVQQYQSQPELLKLILTSKVEEDKRRAEEAKLRSKELDMYLHRITPDYINYKDSEANDQKRRLSEVEDQETLETVSSCSDDEVRLTLSGRPRRRREMQSITKIVETREFPYADSFFWKNNGNTTQKKSGCKSIYFKCSN